MSDRIAVLIGGDLVQVGTPNEVYHDPRDIRVAEFIGSPKINILPAEIGSDGRVDLLGRPTGLVSRAGAGKASIGIRPEALRLADGRNGALSGQVCHIENLGAELIVHLRIGDMAAPTIMRTDAASGAELAIGKSLAVDFPRDALYAFDGSGRRVDAAVYADRQVVNG